MFDEPLILIMLVSISLFILFLLWVIWSDIIGAGFEPTSRKRVFKMLDMARVRSDDVVYDLGSGDGRIVIYAARKFNAQAVGIEADPLRFIWSKLMILLLGIQKEVSIVWGNFFKQDLSKATVVTLFLSQKANQNLKTKLQMELQPGTRIVSYFWKFTGWEPIMADDDEKIYMYIIGKTSHYYYLDKK
jgi:hypothetical protein